MSYPKFSSINVRVEIKWHTDDPDVPVDKEYYGIGFNTLVEEGVLVGRDNNYELNKDELKRYLKELVDSDYAVSGNDYDIVYTFNIVP